MQIISMPEVRDIHDARAKRRELLTRMANLEQRIANGDNSCRPLLEADREAVQALETFIEHEQKRREARDRAESEGQSDPYEPPAADARTMPITGGRAGGLWRALQQGGWDLRSNPGVTVSLREALRSTFPDPATYSPRPAGDIVPLPFDSRYLWSVFPAVDIGMDTSVQDFRQTAREVTGTVERALGQTDEKATLSVGIEHVTAEVRQFAVVLKDIPSAVLESLPTAQRFFETEARRALNQAIDQHCYNAIINANPPSGDTGADLIQRVRHAVAAMRSNGANPTVLALNPTDAVALDLAQQPSGDGDGDYIFPTRATGSASPLWGLTVFESPIVTDPLLIDPQMIGQLYLGSLSVLADPYSKLAQNLVDIRFELRALLHVRSAFGAYVIAGDGA